MDFSKCGCFQLKELERYDILNTYYFLIRVECNLWECEYWDTAVLSFNEIHLKCKNKERCLNNASIYKYTYAIYIYIIYPSSKLIFILKSALATLSFSYKCLFFIWKHLLATIKTLILFCSNFNVKCENIVV